MSAECQLPPGEDHVPYLLLSLFQVVSLLRPPEEEASRAEEEAGFRANKNNSTNSRVTLPQQATTVELHKEPTTCWLHTHYRITQALFRNTFRLNALLLHQLEFHQMSCSTFSEWFCVWRLHPLAWLRTRTQQLALAAHSPLVYAVVNHNF